MIRAVLRPYLESLDVSPVGCDDLLLVATELATNAIEAGSARGEIKLRVGIERGAVTMELDDDGAGFELPSDDASPSAAQDRGRGLWLARNLTNDLTVTRRRGRTVVRAVRRLDGEARRLSASRGAPRGR